MTIPSVSWAKAIQAVHSGRVLVITGAGISAESGIPTFRGADGYWTVGSERYTPQEIAMSSTLEHQPEVLWDWYLHRLKSYVDKAEPNAAHYALADLYMAMDEDRFLCVTQNIDEFHIRAGIPSSRCIEIHGNGRLMRCLNECWLQNNHGVPKFTEIPEDATFPDSLTCSDCGSLMRPHVLLFDERYSQELYRSVEAQDFVDDPSGVGLVLTIGCSGVVPLAQILANAAVRQDAVVIDVNPEENPLAVLAQQQGLWLQGTATEMVPHLVAFLTAGYNR